LIRDAINSEVERSGIARMTMHVVFWRWEAKDIAEVPVEGDQCSSFSREYLYDMAVGGASESLITHANSIMSGGFDHLEFVLPEVFIQLEFHGVYFAGTGTILSRAASVVS
jgi:hypothetical protein